MTTDNFKWYITILAFCPICSTTQFYSELPECEGLNLILDACPNNRMDAVKCGAQYTWYTTYFELTIGANVVVDSSLLQSNMYTIDLPLSPPPSPDFPSTPATPSPIVSPILTPRGEVLTVEEKQEIFDASERTSWSVPVHPL